MYDEYRDDDDFDDPIADCLNNLSRILSEPVGTAAEQLKEFRCSFL